MSDRPAVVVLTGGIASGKTVVSERFAELGVPVIDTDVLARDVVAPGSEGLDAVVEAFGDEVVDEHGGLDRAALRERIFSDPAARRRLESLLHPPIAARAEQRLRALGSGTPYALLVVPLLVESGLFTDAERVLVVDVPEKIQLERLQRRDGMEPELARAALQAQADREQRLARADDVIDNTGSLEDLRRQVDDLHGRYLERWRGPEP